MSPLWLLTDCEKFLKWKAEAGGNVCSIGNMKVRNGHPQPWKCNNVPSYLARRGLLCFAVFELEHCSLSCR